MTLIESSRDARSLDHAVLEEMRRLAVRRVLAGESQADVATSMQVHHCTVWKWVAAYRARGDKALVSRKSSGRPSTLTDRQMARLRRLIVGRNPMQLNFGVALWTIPIIRQLVERLFGIALHETTIARILHKLGLTPQKPTRRAFQRDDDACQRWATLEFPAIVREARRKQATLLFLDESAMHEDGAVATTWGPKGERPQVRVSGSRRRTNIISAVSPRGRLWFRCFRGTLTAARFIEFLRALQHDVRGEIVLVLDRHTAHTAAMTRRYLLTLGRRLTVHYLPAYAPDMNPDEHVWAHLKMLFRRDPLARFEDFDGSVQLTMENIAADRTLVKSFFGHPEVAYVKKALNW
jgi:transposase